jgi:IclR family acetate operon transcriptional repressor
MSGNGTAGRSVISKLSAILLTFTEGGSLSLSEVTERSGLPMSTTHRLVNELAAWRILERDEHRRFRPGQSLRALGGAACCTMTSMRDLAAPVLEDLFRATGRETRFGILDGEVVKYIHKSSTHSPVSEFSPAATLPLHATALGKVLLAFTPAEIVDVLLSTGLRVFTPHTTVELDRIRWTLKLVRAHRFAVSEGELREDYSAIAAPVFGAVGRPVAALEVRVADVATLGKIERPMLAVAAASLSRDLYRSCCCAQMAEPIPARSATAQPVNRELMRASRSAGQLAGRAPVG